MYSVTVTAFDGTTGTDATFEWVVTNPAPTAVDDSNGTDETRSSMRAVTRCSALIMTATRMVMR